MSLATFGGLQFFSGGEQAFGSSLSSSASRGSITFGQKAFLNPTAQSVSSGSFNARALGANRQSALAVCAQALELEQRSIAKGQRYTVPNALPVWMSLRTFLVLMPEILSHAFTSMMHVLLIKMCFTCRLGLLGGFRKRAPWRDVFTFYRLLSMEARPQEAFQQPSIGCWMQQPASTSLQHTRYGIQSSSALLDLLSNAPRSAASPQPWQG